MSFPIGDTVLITSTVYDTAGALSDPISIEAIVKAPSGTTSSPTVAPVSTGIYQILVETDEVGIWRYRVTAEGNDTDAVGESQFCVVASSI